MRPPRRMTARYAGTCADCGAPIEVGALIDYRRPDAVHAPGCTLPATPTTTHRERLEAKAERRESWAQSRAEQAERLHARNEPYRGDIAFNTQPGHIPERARVIARTEKAWEHSAKAREHESKAAGIETQLARSIFDDDPDAIEALTAKLERLEAERERWKSYNAACRKAKASTAEALALLDAAQRADLASTARVCAWQLGKYGQAPSYVTANLGGNISRLRQRIARLERQTTTP